ncbi:MAG: carbohydrate-binding family 9-like protein [Draconibacterium sp.]
MNRKLLAIGLFCILGLPNITGAQSFAGFENLFTPVRNYVVYQTVDKVNVDGRAKEKAWEKAQWSEYFEDIEGDLKPRPTYKTRFKMLWDAQNIYFWFELEEPDVWAYYDRNDMVVFHENDIEIFIDPDRDCYNYFEFELNARNILFDLFLDKPYRNGGRPDIDWDAVGFESAVFIDGTLNNPSDKDQKWCIEVKIPFSALSVNGKYLQPQNDDTWKMNFSRVEWQTTVLDGKYIKRKDETSGKNIPENNWVWSPQGVINMHFPERWGFVRFSEKQPGSDDTVFQVPEEELLVRHLWQVYYKQQEFKRENKRFASSFNELQLTDSGVEKDLTFKLEMTASSDNFEVKLSASDGCVILLNSSSLVSIQTK